MICENEVQTLVERLKEFAFLISFSLTLARRSESEIIESIILSRQYEACREHGADAVLKEIIQLQIEQGKALGLEELKRQEDEAEELRREREAVEAEQAKVSIERWKFEGERQKFKQEKLETDRAIAADKEKVIADAAEVAREQAKLERKKFKFLLLKGGVAAFFLGLLFIPARDIMLRPYFQAKQELVAERSALAKKASELRAWREQLLGWQVSLKRLEVWIHQQQQRLPYPINELIQREKWVNEQERQLAERRTALETDIQRFNDRYKSELGEIENRRQLLEQRISELGRREEEEARRPVTVTLVNRSASDAEAVISGVPVNLKSGGSASVVLQKGRHRYSLKLRTGFYDLKGSGYLDIRQDEQEFRIQGQFPNVWIAGS